MILFRFRLFLLCFFLLIPAWAHALDVNKLPDSDIQKVKQIIAKLEPVIQKRDAEKNLASMTFKDLYAPLSKNEAKFLKKFLKLKRKEVDTRIPWQGISSGEKDLVMFKGQKVKEKIRTRKDGKLQTELVSRTLPPQYLPRLVAMKYLAMMDEMERDIGKRLYIESGYRPSAFQLYLFVYYLQNHKYSIKETVKFVALPGYSEHGSPEHQAIDFINKDGVNGDPNTAEFEALPENKWLLDHAHEFGFVLSYPKNCPTGITYEPWHWRYDPKEAKKQKKTG
jgi:hypothetical protein